MPLGRVVLGPALTAAGAATALLAACEPPSALVSPVALSVPPVQVHRAFTDAAAPVPGGRCPSDAPWNGRVCLGAGYVACPGEARFDDAAACRRAPVEAEAGMDAGMATPAPR